MKPMQSVSDGIRDVDLYGALLWLRDHDLPYGEAIVEHFPKFNYATYRYQPDGEIFAYQFLSPEGRNIATYIPCVGTLMTQPGLDGLGRIYGFPILERRHFCL